MGTVEQKKNIAQQFLEALRNRNWDGLPTIDEIGLVPSPGPNVTDPMSA